MTTNKNPHSVHQGNRLKFLIKSTAKKQKITEAEIAVRLKLNPTSLPRIYRREELSADIMARVTKYFGVDEDLFTSPDFPVHLVESEADYPEGNFKDALGADELARLHAEIEELKERLKASDLDKSRLIEIIYRMGGMSEEEYTRRIGPVRISK